MKTVYVCTEVQVARPSDDEFYVWENPPHLQTENVAELADHQRRILENPNTARSHILDIRTDGGTTGMCLPDAVVDQEEKTVKWFMDTIPGRNREIA